MNPTAAVEEPARPPGLPSLMLPVRGGSNCLWAGHHLPPAPTDALPWLVCHGGPGIPSDSLFPLMGPWHRPVIFFDQLGCGRSERPDPAVHARLAETRQTASCGHPRCGAPCPARKARGLWSAAGGLPADPRGIRCRCWVVPNRGGGNFLIWGAFQLYSPGMSCLVTVTRPTFWPERRNNSSPENS